MTPGVKNNLQQVSTESLGSPVKERERCRRDWGRGSGHYLLEGVHFRDRGNFPFTPQGKLLTRPIQSK